MTDNDSGAGGEDDQSGGYSRRRLLAGLTAVAGSGAVGGGALGLTFDDSPEQQSAEKLGTSPIENIGGFWDTEISGNLNANILQGGKLDLEACWEQPGEDCSPDSTTSVLDLGPLSFGETQRATLRCDISDNPGWLWFRTSCPEDACGLERGVKLTVWYDDGCDGTVEEDQIITASDGTKIDDLRLCDALSKLRSGILLDGDRSTDGDDPFQPDGNCCIGFEFRADEEFCVDDDDEVSITVDLYAEQRRHHPDPSPPPTWTDDCEVDCNDECPPCDFQGISFVAFCIEDGSIDTGDITFTPYYDIEGEPYKLDWQSDVPLEWVVLFYGQGGKGGGEQCFENFHVDGDTQGSVHVNSEENTPNDTDFDSKFCLNVGQGDKGGQGGKGGPNDDKNDDKGVTEYGQCPRDPCPDFGTESDVTQTDYGCGVKYNFDGGVWDDVCKQTCKEEE